MSKLLNVLSKIGSYVLDEVASYANQKMKEAERISNKLEQEERKLKNIANSSAQSIAKKEQITAQREKIERMKKQSESFNKLKESIGNRTLSEWDKMWGCIGPLKSANLSQYSDCVGLYRHEVNKKVMYVGRAVEWNNGGLRKRLSDYRRDSDSGRKHQSGQTINKNLDNIITYVLVVGKDEKAVEITKKLERLYIAKYAPAWNMMLR